MPTDIDDLNSLAEFDSPFEVDEHGNVTERNDVFAPSVMLWCDDEGNAIGEAEIDSDGWSYVDGYSGQDRYSGPVMHPSEYLGGRMARDVLAEPGIYVVCEVINPDDMDELIGWVLLRKKEA